MSIERWAVFLAIGAASGWLAGRIVRGGGFGLLGNVAVGIVGAFVGGHLLGWLGIAAGGGWLGAIAKATLGAVALLYAIRLIKRV